MVEPKIQPLLDVALMSGGKESQTMKEGRLLILSANHFNDGLFDAGMVLARDNPCTDASCGFLRAA